MKLHQVMLSQAIRFMEAQPAEPKPLLVHLVRGLEERYGFLQIPRTVPEYNFQNGVTFLHGTFANGLLIDKFQVYEQGLLCEAKQPMDFCESFLDDVVNWARGKFGLSLSERTGPSRAYLSQIEVTTDANIATAMNKFSDVGKAISAALKSYGQDSGDFEVAGVRMHLDTTAAPPPSPLDFVFERRAGHPYSENLYFSSAPLQTKDHMNILDQLESVLAA